MPPSKRSTSVSSARGARPHKNVKTTSRETPIDFSDIPELSAEQLARMRPVGRPTLGEQRRSLIAIRLDPAVIHAFRLEADRRGIGYQSLISEVLADQVRKWKKRAA